MSEPLRTVTLTGDLTQITGGPAVGYVLVSSYKTTRAPGAELVLVTQPNPVQLVDGKFAVRVPVSDQVGLEEQCLIEVQILLQDDRPDALVLVVNTDDEQLDISQAVRVPVAYTDTSVPVVPWRALGQAGGVAPLDGEAKIPSQYLPAGQGGTVAKLDDLTDVTGADAASAGTVLRKGADGIWRPEPAGSVEQRGDAMWWRTTVPEPAELHQVNDVWVNTTDFGVFQVEES